MELQNMTKFIGSVTMFAVAKCKTCCLGVRPGQGYTYVWTKMRDYERRR